MNTLYWLGALGAIASLLGSLGLPPAQAQRLCDTGEYEPDATTQRTVTLPQFGLAVTIPSNYRALRRQDGAVEILHPQDYEFIQCILAGGLGGRGYYSESLRLVPRDRRLSLREQALVISGNGADAVGPGGLRARAEPYRVGDWVGYLVESVSGYSVTFVSEQPRQPQFLLVVYAGCDCSVEREAMRDFLSRMQRL